IPLAAITARRSAGFAMRRRGLLRSPEEVQATEVLAGLRRLTQAPQAEPITGIQRLLNDARLLLAHRAMLPLRPPPRPATIDTPLAVARARLEAAQTAEEA